LFSAGFVIANDAAAEQPRNKPDIAAIAIGCAVILA